MSRSRFRFSVVGALVAVALLAPVAATAGVKVDVCHRSSDGSFQLINISENAFTADVDHGDAAPGEPVPGQDGFVFDDTCTPIEDTPQFAVFARATSTDTAGGVHVLAEWVDTDDDNAVSFGDTVFVYELPTAIPPGPADYVTTSWALPVAGGQFLSSSATSVQVSSFGEGSRIQFRADANHDAFYVLVLSTEEPLWVEVQDYKGLHPAGFDRLLVPGASDQLDGPDGDDGEWLTVEIFI